MRLVFADTPPPGELVLEQQIMKRECDESMIWDLKQHPEKAATNFMTRWPDAVPAIAQHSQPMGENLRGFDQFTVNERLIGRRLGTFDVSFYITPIDFSQFSPAQHAEQTALKILALDEQCRLTIGDQVNDAINDYRSAPAERSSLVVSAGPPPSFEALDSGAPSAPSAIVDERSCVPAQMPVAGVMTVVTAVSPKRVAVSVTVDSSSGSSGSSGSDAFTAAVLPEPTPMRIPATPPKARAKQARSGAVDPKCASAPGAATPRRYSRALSGVIVLLGFVLCFSFTVTKDDEVRDVGIKRRCLCSV